MPQWLDLLHRSVGGLQGTSLQPGHCSLVPGKDGLPALRPELGFQPHLFPRFWLALGCRALESPHRTSTQARPLDASRAVGTCGHPPTPAIPSAALLRTSRGPLKPKPPDLQGPAQEKVWAAGPSPSPRPPPSFVNHQALYAGGLAPGLPAQPWLLL